MSKAGYILRYIKIIRKIKKGGYVSLKEINSYLDQELDVDNVGISERTIHRDINDIKNIFGISIKHSKLNNGYYIDEEENIQSDFNSLLELFDLFETFYFKDSLTGIVFPEKRKSRGTEHLSHLIYAIKNNLIAHFFYLKYDNTLSHIRIVEPYALKEFKGRWYLLAMEIDGRPDEKGEIKTWGLDRIQELSVSDKKFSKNTQLNIEDEFRDVFGIHSDKDKPIEEIILSFALTSGRYNESLPLHESQITLIDNNKEFRIRLNVKLTNDLIMELLSQSENMTVISPLHLKEALINIHKSATKRLQIVD